MSANDEFSINDTQKGVRVDFQYFIQLAVKQELPWKTLSFCLTDLTTSLDKSKEVIKELVEELEVWVTKARNDKAIAYLSDGDLGNAGKDGSEIKVQDAEISLAVSEEPNQSENDPNEEFEAKSENEMKLGPNLENHVELKDFYEFIGNDQEKVQNSDMLSHQCKMCSKRFRIKYFLRRHERSHTGEKPFQCQDCRKCFSDTGNLKRHKLIHSGEKPYQCQNCNASFRHHDTLKRHMKRIHTYIGEKPFQCKICKASFKESGTLTRHERTHSQKR